MNNKNVYYCYGTTEYKEKEKSLKINTEEAASILAENYFLSNPDKNDVLINLDIIYNDHYIFSDKLILYNTKTGEYIVENTYWVDGNTKKITKPDKNMLRVMLKIPKNFFEKKYENIK